MQSPGHGLWPCMTHTGFREQDIQVLAKGQQCPCAISGAVLLCGHQQLQLPTSLGASLALTLFQLTCCLGLSAPAAGLASSRAPLSPAHKST